MRKPARQESQYTRPCTSSGSDKGREATLINGSAQMQRAINCSIDFDIGDEDDLKVAQMKTTIQLTATDDPSYAFV